MEWLKCNDKANWDKNASSDILCNKYKSFSILPFPIAVHATSVIVIIIFFFAIVVDGVNSILKKKKLV